MIVIDEISYLLLQAGPLETIDGMIGLILGVAAFIGLIALWWSPDIQLRLTESGPIGDTSSPPNQLYRAVLTNRCWRQADKLKLSVELDGDGNLMSANPPARLSLNGVIYGGNGPLRKNEDLEIELMQFKPDSDDDGVYTAAVHLPENADPSAAEKSYFSHKTDRGEVRLSSVSSRWLKSVTENGNGTIILSCTSEPRGNKWRTVRDQWGISFDWRDNDYPLLTFEEVVTHHPTFRTVSTWLSSTNPARARR